MPYYCMVDGLLHHYEGPGGSWLKPDTTGLSHSGRLASDFSTFPLVGNITCIPLAVGLDYWNIFSTFFHTLVMHRSLPKTNTTKFH